MNCVQLYCNRGESTLFIHCLTYFVTPAFSTTAFKSLHSFSWVSDSVTRDSPILGDVDGSAYFITAVSA